MESAAEERSLAYNLGALLESGHGADVTLVVGDAEFPAHSPILAVRSPVFAAMLTHDTREARTRRIEITDVREAVLKQLLCFVYTDTAPQLDSMAAELLSAANKYDLPTLKKKCEQVVAEGLTVDNAAASAVLAELHGCPLLESAAVDFVVAHPQVLATEGWMNAMRSSVEVAGQFCKQLAGALPSPAPSSSVPPPAKRILSEEQKQKLTEKLLEAATSGSTGEVSALLDAGAPVDGKDGYGNTALHLAAGSSCAAAVKLLIGAGADVNARNSDQSTPLHKAVYQSDVHVMWLLSASADINVQNKAGNTPLHLAAQGYPDQVKALLLAGARRDIENNARRTPASNADSSTRDLFHTY